MRGTLRAVGLSELFGNAVKLWLVLDVFLNPLLGVFHHS